MRIRNTESEFGLVTRVIHWLIAAVFISMIPVGWYMTGLSDTDVLYWRLLDLHILLGMSMFMLLPIKWGWQLASSNPPLSSALAPWERNTARIVHSMLLVAMVAIPVTGFLFADSTGDPLEPFNLVEIPDLGQFSKSTRNVLGDAHYYLAYLCAALIVLHAAGAFKHRFIDDAGGR